MGLGPGSLIGTNIVLERELGHGAMGTVWLAENRSLAAKVAVKVLPIAMTDSEEALLRFRQEAQSAAQLDSPHVVKTFDFGTTTENQPYIVMEVLRGRELRKEIETRGNLPPHEVSIILSQLCRALSNAHQLGMVHRDIKPANIFLLDTPGGEPFVKVLDFGIARLMSAQHMGMTETGAVMGTPYYMSPEQFIDPRRIDHRSDLWSAAVVLYGCLVGKLPFLGETVGALSLAVHRGAFVPVSQATPGLPAALDAFFARALAVDPAQRFNSAEELSSSFDAALRGAGAPLSGGAMASHAPASESMGGAAYPSPASGAHATDGGYGVAPNVPPHANSYGGFPSTTAPGGGYASGAVAPTLRDPSATSAAPLGTTPPGAAPPGPPSATPPGATWPSQGPSAAVHAPTPASFAQTTPPTPARSSAGLWVGIVLAVLGFGALVSAVVIVPKLRATSTETTKASQDDASSASSGKKKKKRKKKSDDDSDDGEADDAPEPPSAPPASTPSATAPQAEPPAPSAPTTAPSVTPSPTPTPKPAPAPAPKPAPTQSKWRPLRMTCAKFDASKSCAACCPKADTIMKPYPSCECFFDGEKWDREHGKAP